MRLKGVSYDVGRVLGMNWARCSTPTSCTANLRSSRPILNLGGTIAGNENAYEHDWPTMLRFIKSH